MRTHGTVRAPPAAAQRGPGPLRPPRRHCPPSPRAARRRCRSRVQPRAASKFRPPRLLRAAPPPTSCRGTARAGATGEQRLRIAANVHFRLASPTGVSTAALSDAGTGAEPDPRNSPPWLPLLATARQCVRARLLRTRACRGPRRAGPAGSNRIFAGPRRSARVRRSPAGSQSPAYLPAGAARRPSPARSPEVIEWGGLEVAPSHADAGPRGRRFKCVPGRVAAPDRDPRLGTAGRRGRGSVGSGRS